MKLVCLFRAINVTLGIITFYLQFQDNLQEIVFTMCQIITFSTAYKNHTPSEIDQYIYITLLKYSAALIKRGGGAA